MFSTSFSISYRSVLARHFFEFVFCLNCCISPYCHIFSNLVFFTDIFISHYVTYVCLLRLMPLCKTCFGCIFIPLHLTKWAVAHESLCSNKKQSTLVHNVLLLLQHIHFITPTFRVSHITHTAQYLHVMCFIG